MKHVLLSWKQALLIFILVISVGFPSITHAQNPTLLVNFSASPSSGSVPLNGVDLSASVSGTAQGMITYRFDCTGDGVWENTYTSQSASATAYDVCNYKSPGVYTAKAIVERGGLSAQGSIVINVTGSPASLNVAMAARNMTAGQTSFGDPVSAKPLDKIEFQIQVTANSGTAYNVTLKHTTPAQLIYLGNLKVNGVSHSGNILLPGILLGDAASGSSLLITFESQLAPDSLFTLGSNDVITTVIASGTNTSGSDAITLKVQRSGVLGAATSVSTGPFSPSIAALLITLAIGFIISYILLLRFYIKNHVLPKAFQTKAEQDLEHVIHRLKRREEQLI